MTDVLSVVLLLLVPVNVAAVALRHSYSRRYPSSRALRYGADESKILAAGSIAAGVLGLVTLHVVSFDRVYVIGLLVILALAATVPNALFLYRLLTGWFRDTE